jgi:hypothetical protein
LDIKTQLVIAGKGVIGANQARFQIASDLLALAKLYGGVSKKAGRVKTTEKFLAMTADQFGISKR